MHGLYAKFGKEPQGNQVQVSVYKTVEAKLGHAIFACLVLHYFFADAVESGIFGQRGDLAMHFTVHFDVLHHVLTVSLESAIEVMQILDA